MVYESREINGITIIQVNLSRATLDKAGEFKAFMHEQINSGADKVIIDLSEVDFIDSTFLGVLVSSLKKIAHMQGDLHLVMTKNEPLGILRLTRIDKVFSIFSNVEDAMVGF